MAKLKELYSNLPMPTTYILLVIFYKSCLSHIFFDINL